MKYLKGIALGAALFGSLGVLKAGNPQRAGSSGASELLINPWARAAGWNALNVANVRGVESSFINIAGAAFTEKTEVSFSNTQWLVGAGIGINAAGFNQAVGENGVLVANFVSFDYGDWERTTVSSPEGGIGQVSPSTAIIGLGYAQKFTEAIRGGINIKLYTSNSVDMSVTAASVDAGVQYVTGDDEELKFGITLKNVGPAAEFSGDGQSVTLPAPQGGFSQAFDERSASFEIPATLMLGGSYDILFTQQRLTLAGAFQSNSFEKDIYSLGAEYSMKEMLSARIGYSFWDNRSYEAETTVFTGLSAGVSFDLPLSKNNQNVISIDYSYRATRTFDGVHAFGVSFSL
jgi:hypothetical protein